MDHWFSEDPRDVLSDHRELEIVIYMQGRCVTKAWINTHDRWHIEIGWRVINQEVRAPYYHDDDWPEDWKWCLAPGSLKQIAEKIKGVKTDD